LKLAAVKSAPSPRPSPPLRAGGEGVTHHSSVEMRPREGEKSVLTAVVTAGSPQSLKPEIYQTIAMKKPTILFPLAALVALPVLAADPAEDVKSAAKKLSEKSYSWSTKTESAQTGGDSGGGRNRGGFGGGGVSGKVDKDGFALVTFTFGENTSEAVIKGDKYAVKSGDEWKTGEELEADAGDGNQGGRGRGMGRLARRTKPPAAQAQELVGTLKDFKKDGDAYTGQMTAEAVKEANTFRFGGRRGGDGGNAAAGPDTANLKGTVKFWVKDGVLSKYETRFHGKMTTRGRDGSEPRERDIDRTTTIEIKDIGTAKVEIPAEAKKKLKS